MTDQSLDRLITIGIPTRNREAMLGRLLGQFRDLWPTVDVLVSDNHSEDGTEACAKGFAGQLRLTYVRRKSLLTPEAHCAAVLESCRTPYLVYFCDDDLIAPAFVAACRAIAGLMRDAATPIGLGFMAFEVLVRPRAEAESPALAADVDLDRLAFTGRRLRHIGRDDYVAEFCATGRGGWLGGMVVDVAALRGCGIAFPIHGGNRCDRLFALTANRRLPVVFNDEATYYRIDHDDNDVRRMRIDNHLLFQHAINELFADDPPTRQAIAAMRLGQWLREALKTPEGARFRDFAALWQAGRPGRRGLRHLLHWGRSKVRHGLRWRGGRRRRPPRP